MKLWLKDFKCFEKFELEIPDVGIILISAPSGSGKSTILNAIVYALYGKIMNTGKNKKPYRHGSTGGCSVTLEYLGLHITRTSKPNRVVLKSKKENTEGDAAQNIIEQTIGMNFDEFTAGAMVKGGGSTGSVLSMTPTEQLHFIQKLAHIDGEAYKTQIKEKRKEYETLSAEKTGAIEMNKSIVEKLKKKYEVPPEDPKISGEQIKGLQDKINKANKNISIISSRSVELNTLLKAQKKQGADEKNRQTEITKLEIEIETLQKSITDAENKLLTSEELAKLTNEITEGSKYQADRQVYIDYISQLEKCDALGEAYFNEISEKVTEYESGPYVDWEISEEIILEANKVYEEWKKHHLDQEVNLRRKIEAKDTVEKIFTFIKKIPDLMASTKNIKKISDMINFLEDVIRESRVKLDFKIFECPACNEKLCIEDDVLVQVDPNSIDEPINELERESLLSRINVVSKKLDILRSVQPIMSTESPDLENIEEPTDPNWLKQGLVEYKAYVKNQKILKDRTLPVSIQKLYDGLKEPTEIDLTINLAELNKKLSIQRTKKDEHEQAKKLKDHLTKEFVTKNKKLDVLKKVQLTNNGSDDVSYEDLQNELTNNLQRTIDLKKEIEGHETIIAAYKEFIEYKKHRKELKDELDNIITLIKTKKQYEDNVEGCLGLEEACKEAEILALEKTVTGINAHSEIYLKEMFEDPITVYLTTVKETSKSVKLQMNTLVEYKDTIYDSIDELSSGERQRCDLAFLLGVSDMLSGSILLLDECLNNLNEEINTDILSKLKAYISANNKLCIVIAHEVKDEALGIFDDIVKLNND